jgi:hypothetical protein
VSRITQALFRRKFLDTALGMREFIRVAVQWKNRPPED